MGLHLDLESIYLDNRSKSGVYRKNGLIVNVGNNPTKKEICEKREANKHKYGLSQTFVQNLKLPKA
jgi:hypothetical protein